MIRNIYIQISRNQWVEEFARKILKLGQLRRDPLDADADYAEQLTEQLYEYFDDPLLRDLVETSC